EPERSVATVLMSASVAGLNFSAPVRSLGKLLRSRIGTAVSGACSTCFIVIASPPDTNHRTSHRTARRLFGRILLPRDHQAPCASRASQGSDPNRSGERRTIERWTHLSPHSGWAG